MKTKIIFLLASVSFVLLIISSCSKKPQGDIKIGAIFDLSGATSDVGKEYADAIIDYVKYVNENGGINGRKINLIYKDYEYKISQAYSMYEDLKRKEVLAIVGWGTGDTEALTPKINADKIPFISASYSDMLADGVKYPYNFIGATSYADQSRIALKFIRKETGKSDIKVAFVYNDTSFGRSAFFPGAEEYAKEIGIKATEKVVIPLSGENAKEKIKMLNADWMIVQETGTASIAIVKAVKELKKATKIILLNWAIDEKVAEEIGNIATNTIFGIIPYGVWNDKLEGIILLHQINSKYHPDEPVRTCRYIQGYINIAIILEAVKNAGNDLTRDRIKKEIENLQNFDTKASLNLISFSEKIHKPSSSVMVYKLEGKKIIPQSQLLVSIDKKIWAEY